MSRLPRIGITACSWQIDSHAVQMVDDKYAQAVISAAKGLPLILPQFPELLDPGTNFCCATAQVAATQC
jgi:putative glutamine amidotransferase